MKQWSITDMGIWEADTEAFCDKCKKEVDCKYYNFNDEQTGMYCLECEEKIKCS